MGKRSWRSKLKDRLILFFVKIKNFFFCLKYPFWKSRNVWTGKFMGYSCTWYDAIPFGWRKAFGKQLSKDIRKALKEYKKKHPKAKYKDLLHWLDIKEKYGELRLYCDTIHSVQDICHKYELLSMGYCIECGKPARYCTHGWVEFYCESCYDDYHKDVNNLAEHKKEERLKEEDIPHIRISSNDGVVDIDIKEKYGIDFYELWGIKKVNK